jgi:hypothetical protein
VILGANGRPLEPARPSPTVHNRAGDWEGNTLLIELIKPWLNYQPGDRVEAAPNEGEWLVRTGRGKEVEADAADEAEAE